MKIIKIIITIIALVFLIWFIVPKAYGIFNIGNIAGILICLCLIFRFGFSSLYERLKAALSKKSVSKMILRIIQTAAFAFVIYAVVISGAMTWAMLQTPTEGATAVVLGAEVKPWGPSALLQQRIDAAEKYLKDDPETYAVVTGGKGSNEVLSEAQCMYETLINQGIEPYRIFREAQAINTDQNIRYSLDIVTDNELNSNIAVVSDSYHQLRARIIAFKNAPQISVGAVNAKNNNVGIIAYPAYFIREWLAIPVEIVK